MRERGRRGVRVCVCVSVSESVLQGQIAGEHLDDLKPEALLNT